jgi:glutamate formiminotransferase / 5-formyltetrahydrofolate cyclo-ligase
MGLALEDRGIVQVSMNLTNYEKTPIFRVFETGEARGGALRRHGPRKRDRRARAVGGAGAAAEYYLQLEGFGADQVLENKLAP